MTRNYDKKSQPLLTRILKILIIPILPLLITIENILVLVLIFPTYYNCDSFFFLVVFWILTWALVLVSNGYSHNELRGIMDLNTSRKKKVFFVCAALIVFCVLWLFLLILFGRELYHLSNYLSGYISTSFVLDNTYISYSETMAHIEAVNDHDAFFANGFVHAQNRLFQMEVQRRFARGTLGNVFGRNVDNLDFFSRTMGFYDRSIRSKAKLSPATISVLKLYCNGINFYIKNYRNHGPIEFSKFDFWPEPDWMPEDAIAIMKMAAYQLSGNSDDELIRLNAHVNLKTNATRILQFYPKYKGFPSIIRQLIEDQSKFNLTKEINELDHLMTQTSLYKIVQDTHGFESIYDSDLIKYVFPQSKAKSGFSFVLSGNLTKSGKPYICNSLNLQLSQPSALFAIHIKSDRFDMVGASIPGVPGVISGHNDKLSWGISPTQLDQKDCILLESIDEFGYQLDGKYVKYSTDTFRGKFKLRNSVYGPIINDLLHFNFSLPIALYSTSLSDEDTTLDAIVGLAYSSDWNEMRQSFSSWVAPAISIVYADRTGNIGYQLAGRLPIRSRYSGFYPIYGNNSGLWNGFVDYWAGELSMFNPIDRNIILATDETFPDEYAVDLQQNPLMKAIQTYSYRSQRIIEMLNTIVPPFTTDDIHSIQCDIKSEMFMSFRYLFRFIKFSDKNYQEMTDYLYKHDGTMDKNSFLPLLFANWWRSLMDIVRPELGINDFDNPSYFHNLFANRTYPDPLCKRYNYDCYKLAAEILQSSIEKGGFQTVKSNQKYGIFHLARSIHIVYVKTFNCIWRLAYSKSGDAYTLNHGAYDLNNFNMNQGSVFKYYMDLGSDKFCSHYSLAGGVSEDFNSRNFASLYHLWIHDTYSQICLKTPHLSHPLYQFTIYHLQ